MNRKFDFFTGFMGFFLLVLSIFPALACSKAETETINLSEILAQAASVTEVKYEFTMTRPDLSASIADVWVKGSKWRIEYTSIGQGYFVDTEAETCYVWYTPENILKESSYPYVGLDILDYISYVNKAKWVAMYNPRFIGTETIDGKSSLLIEFTYEPESGQEAINGKAWIWKEKPFILRFEMISGVNGTLIMEFKNIDFGDIPDSIFEEP
jgi:outer membrane lipoprotein-sorting protein